MPTRPDWIMLGARTPDGCQVYASTDLDRAELEMHVEMDRDPFSAPWDAPRMRPTSTVFELRASMGTVVMATGRDYTEALRTLFEHWSPEDGDRRDPTQELTAPTLELDP